MRLPLLSVFAFAGAALLPAVAQDIDTTDREAIARDTGDWEVEFGASATALPNYPGSDSLQVLPLPYFYIEYKDKWFAHPTSGVGYYFKNDGNEFVSTSLTYLPGRQEDDAAVLTGLGDLDGGIAARAAAQFDMTYFVLGGFITHQLSGDETGTEATLYATTRIKPSERSRIFPTVRVVYADDERNQAFFGVTPQQAAASVFPAYEADGGIKSYGIQFQGLYDLNDEWRLAGQFSWDVLQGDVADSPIVQDENQYIISVGAIKKFR